MLEPVHAPGLVPPSMNQPGLASNFCACTLERRNSNVQFPILALARRFVWSICILHDIPSPSGLSPSFWFHCNNTWLLPMQTHVPGFLLHLVLYSCNPGALCDCARTADLVFCRAASPPMQTDRSVVP